jgi:dipeptidyl-peptidase 4
MIKFQFYLIPMILSFHRYTAALTTIFLLICLGSSAQLKDKMLWSADGNSFYLNNEEGIVSFTLTDLSKNIILAPDQLTPPGEKKMLEIQSFSFSSDYKKLLIFANAKKVWRYETRGDYWVFDLEKKSLVKLGHGRRESSLMYAKFSPDATKAAYVSEHNLYVEDLSKHEIKAITRNGTRKMINGTFDWVYEEEFDCRDGFRWSPDSRAIAYWEINDSSTRDYDMLNTTDSVYSHIIPVEYPVAGQLPSPYRIGVVHLKEKQTNWMKIPKNVHFGNYLPRMEWAANSDEIIVQQLNRNQNESDVLLCNAKSGDVKSVFKEKDSAWIDIISSWDKDYQMGGWDWLNGGKEFLWPSEKDGWRHLYRISRDGKTQRLITAGPYDVMDISLIDEKNNILYFMASPDNATQAYLYRCKLDGSSAAERVTPASEPGSHSYELSPNGKFALHAFSNYYTPNAVEWLTLGNHQALAGSRPIKIPDSADRNSSGLSFIKIQTKDGVSMDGWMQKPENFDSTKKYPVLFFVYTEPGEQTVLDEFGIAGQLNLYNGSLSKDGYIYISVDNRGTPAPKGTSWRKSIHRKIGQLNIQDQAEAAEEICRWPFVDTARIAVWGWSGGGSATLNLLFQHPEIYKTGIAVAALTDLATYDNIYMERYMGNPLETKADYQKGSPLTYASRLQGNLLYIHGTGDDNVHFNNAEMLVNELIKNNKKFQYMAYPNRTHNINEGPGTSEHLRALFTDYLRTHCPGGPK